MRLVTTLRGDGTLLWSASGARPVSYSIAVFGQGSMRSASGDVQGDLKLLVARSPANTRLRLEGGAEVQVKLSNIGHDAAVVELLAPLPEDALGR
jgi:hypothetical protein